MNVRILVTYCKMERSFIFLKFSMILFSLPFTRLASQNNSLSPAGNSPPSVEETKGEAINRANGSSICKFRINKSAIEEIDRSMQNYATNVVEIAVSVVLWNRTRVFSDLKWPWASEIGRTIITLKGQTSDMFSNVIAISFFHFIILEHGIKDVKVVVFEENPGCLQLTRGNRSELVFDFLLHQLSDSSDHHDYTLCRPNSNNDSKQYDCCRTASNGELTICAKYSSIILEYAGYYIKIMVLLIVCVVLPFIRQFLRSMPNEREYYAMTESPMAIPRIMYTVFLEGSDNPVISLYRRLSFSFAVVVILTISFSEWKCIVASWIWAIIFSVYDLFGLNENFTKDTQRDSGIFLVNTYKTYLIILTSPFDIKFWWNTFQSIFCVCLSRNQILHSTNLESQPLIPTTSRRKTTRILGYKRVCAIFMQCLTHFCFGFLYTVSVVPICVIVHLLCLFLTCAGVSFEQMKRLDARDEHRYWALFKQIKCICIFFIWLSWLIVSCGVMIAFAYLSLNLVLYLVTGLYLNGSFFGPIVVPMLVLLVYAWSSWKSFVEIEYLQLKTKIYEVCEEHYKSRKEKSSSGTFTATTSSSHLAMISNASYTVNVKEGTVSKALYDKIRENLLPYHEVLFYFFVRMCLIGNFCLVVVGMMYLAQKSNDAAVPAQVMSTIVISTIPLIFDTVLGGHGTELRDANGKKLKRDLGEIMKMEVKNDDDIVTVKLQFTEQQKNVDGVLNDLCRLFKRS